MTNTGELNGGQGTQGSTLGSTEDVSWDAELCVKQLHNEKDKQRKQYKKELLTRNGRKILMWTVNVGGLQGAWRAVNLIGELPPSQRPKVVCLQESSCTDPQWQALQRVMTRSGYRGYHTGGRQLGERHQTYNWHRGVLTFISDEIESNFLGEVSWRGGQFHAVVVDRVLLFNYYCAPREEYITEQACKCQDYMEQIRWKGKWVLCGDFNETFSGSWISTLAVIYGGWQAEHSLQSTRWAGDRVIDYYVANFELKEMSTRDEKISDHKIVVCEMEHHYKIEAEQWRFKQGPLYTQPMWLTKERWKKLFDEAYHLGAMEQWQESCYMVEQQKEWDQIEDNEGQQVIDYEWCLTCAQLSWSFSMAFRLALLEVPPNFDNEAELRRVLHLVNHVVIKGFESQIQRRQFPNNPKHMNQKLRRRSVRIGRLHELSSRYKRRIFDQETINLVKLLYGHEEVEDLEAGSIDEELRTQEELQNREENADMQDALSKWKTNMRYNIKAKSSWINKKGSKYSASIDTERGITATKKQAAEELHRYWLSLWETQKWTEEEKPEKIRRLTELLGNNMEEIESEEERPGLEVFQARMRSISGCAGSDCWNSEELQIIASSYHASKTIWDVMSRWEIFAAIPSSLKHCKLVHIPKKEQRVLKPGQFRPIAIMSAFWRSWSSTWMRSGLIEKWTAMTFPSNVTGGVRGAQGPEVMASIIAHELSNKKFGLTMDFKHAFDTIDLDVMLRVFRQLLPSATARWYELLFEQWKTMQRWVVYDSGVHPEPMQRSQGLPQGDPSSCVVMATMMLGLKKMVDLQVSEDGMEVFQAIYMDDRTAVAKTEDKLVEIQQKWNEVACDYHLIENPDKAQWVNMRDPSSSFEVLGTVIGNYQEQKQSTSRLNKRVDGIGMLYKKINLLPTRIHEKLNDVGTFGRSRLAYGWISLRPKRQWINRQEQAMWKALGRINYANPHMRRTISGANTSLRMVAFLRQLRLLSQRNQRLQEQSVEVTQCQLDRMVFSTLEDLNWRFEGGKYVHELYAEGFAISELLDDNVWRKTGHYVRESYRQVHFGLYGESGRHELSDHVFPPYDIKRREMACRWAKNDGLAWMLIQGAVQSPNVRLKSTGIHSRCVECGEAQPTWDHLWKCFTGEAAPQDFLLRRFLWPREKADLALCQSFLDGLRRFNDGQ